LQAVLAEKLMGQAVLAEKLDLAETVDEASFALGADMVDETWVSRDGARR
jgi:hypothetical protein